VIRVIRKPIGFVENPGKEDIIIFEENLNCALNRDLVEIEIIGKDSYGRGRLKGKVLRVLERNKTKFVGTFKKSGNGLIFIPDDYRFYRSVELTNITKEAMVGMKALVSLKSWKNRSLNPKGEIVKIIGKEGLHETEMQSILIDKGIVYNFPEEVEREALNISKLEENITNEEIGKRRDFRKIKTFTIDPVDAKDFDDALSFEELNQNTIRVGIHIADVSHFVKPDTILDKESMKRGFSTYLVDRTIPMLPEILSNDLCSLKPDVDRLAFSAVFDIDKKSGRVLERWFGKSIIRSQRRFTYEEAQEIVDGSKQPVASKEIEFQKELKELDRLAKIYKKENKKNGAIEFETDEIKFELDSEGKPIKIFKKSRLNSMKMIEEWMLLANREVAEFMYKKGLKGGGVSVFRIHDIPDEEKIETLGIFVRALGHDLTIGKLGIKSKDINALLKSIEGHSIESLIKTATLRTMAKAIYSTKNIGHFGLGFQYYTHFTSPIRRYPDLMVHRILESYLNNRPIPKSKIVKFEKILQQASEKEKDIQEAEWDSIRYKQVEFMKDKIGQTFETIISGVSEWGFYVQEVNTKSEGLVRLKDINDDHYKLDAKNYSVVGLKTKKKYSLGDKVKVRLVAADLERKTLDFKLVAK